MFLKKNKTAHTHKSAKQGVALAWHIASYGKNFPSKFTGIDHSFFLLEKKI